MAKKTPSGGAKKSNKAKGTLSKVKDAVVEAAEKVAEVVTHAAEAGQKHVVTPVAEAVGIVKKKKARYVREKKQKTPETKAVEVTPKGKTAAGKMMSKNVSIAPKEVRAVGPKSKSRKKS